MRGALAVLIALLSLPVVAGGASEPAGGGPLPRMGWEAAQHLGCRLFSLPLAALEGRFEKGTRRGPPVTANGVALTVAVAPSTQPGGAHRESGLSGLAPENRVPMEDPPAQVGSGLPADFAAALERAGVKPQQISIWFGEADSTEARFHWLPETPRNPASVLKIVTTAQALEQLGPVHRWTTRAWAEGPVRRGTLQGRLVIEGAGDPRLRRSDLRSLLAQVRAAGILRIDGDLVIDRNAFDLPTHDPGAFDGQPKRAYNVGADALLVDLAAQSVNTRVDTVDGRVHAWLEPMLDGVRLDNRLRSVAGDCKDWRLRPLMQVIDTTAAQTVVRVEGEVPDACETASIDIAPVAGPEYTRRVLLQTWRELGGEVSGQVADGRLGYGMRVVGELQSAPLADLIRDINRFSNNVMADQVWLTAGAQTSGWPATRTKATEATQAWLAALGGDDAETIIDSGSGLSRRTRISAEQLHAVLRRMARSPLFPEFAASLPIAGHDGTAARTRVQSHARLKTGSLNGVRAAAGYVRDRSGRWLSLVVMVEAAPDTGWRDLLAWLADRAAATDGPVP